MPEDAPVTQMQDKTSVETSSQLVVTSQPRLAPPYSSQKEMVVIQRETTSKIEYSLEAQI